MLLCQFHRIFSTGVQASEFFSYTGNLTVTFYFLVQERKVLVSLLVSSMNIVAYNFQHTAVALDSF